jgi:glyoxylase-like metal-dependent hydrolase (beta-lactamase superfamily II)
MQALAAGISYFDLNFRNHPRIIATVVLQHSGGVALLDPGPSSTLPVLRETLGRAGIAIADVTSILLTHIHLDHAGVTGTLVAENPALRVYVHEIGAPHLVDPTRLLASAGRLYGDAMERLWGEVRPVPASALTVLTGQGDEQVDAGGRRLRIAYTPGHASHHVSYFSPETGIAFVGDTGGVMLHPGGYVLPPTPPPDIDLDVWRASLARIEEWHPDSLFLTHFGPVSPAPPHFAELREHMELVAKLAAMSIERGSEDSEREAWFGEQLMRELRRRGGDREAAAYEVAARFDLNWRGLARYLRNLPMR